MRNYFKNLSYYFPIGKFWNNKNNSNSIIGQFIKSVSQEFEYTDNFIADFFEKFSPYLADDYWLDLWERNLGIPDDVFFKSTDIEQRRQFVLAKLFIRKVQNIDDYYRLAEILNVEINILFGESTISSLPFTLPFTLISSAAELDFVVIVEFTGLSQSFLSKTLPFTLKSEFDNDVILRKLFNKIKPVDTQFSYRYA